MSLVLHSSTAQSIGPKIPALGPSSLRQAEFDIRPVAGIDEMLACDQLVRRMYAWRGYLAATPEHSRHNGRQIVLAAWQDGELAATVTLTGDGDEGLLCETLYPDETIRLREQSRHLCEYSRLATDPRLSSPDLLDAFFRSAYHIAQINFGATDAVVEINPRHRRYYERELGFNQIGPRRTCPRVNAPALLLHRDLRPTQPDPAPAIRAA